MKIALVVTLLVFLVVFSALGEYRESVTRKPLDLFLGFGVYVAAFIALTIGLISLRIQNKARKDRIEQEEHKANKLRFQISEELNNLRKLYVWLQKRVVNEEGPILLSNHKLTSEFEEALHKLENLYRQPIMLKMSEVFTLELIISTTRALVKDSPTKKKVIEETLTYIDGLKNEMWETKKAALQINSEKRGDSEKNRNSKP